MNYCNCGMSTGSLILEGCHLMLGWFLLFKNLSTLFYLYFHRGLCFLLLALCYAVGILFRLVYFREVLDHLHCLHLSYFLWDIICFLPFLVWNHFLLFDQLTFIVHNQSNSFLGETFSSIYSIFSLCMVSNVLEKSLNNRVT